MKHPTPPVPLPASPALRHRLADLIDQGDRGTLHGEPDALAALFHCCALLLGGDLAAKARELADWYDAETEADAGDADELEAASCCRQLRCLR